MNILDKIEVVCIRIEDLHEKLMIAHELCNEPGIDSELKLIRYLEVERLNNVIESLKELKNNLFIEAGLKP